MDAFERRRLARKVAAQPQDMPPLLFMGMALACGIVGMLPAIGAYLFM